MPQTYAEIVAEQRYEDMRREWNLCAQGNGENPHPVRPDGMSVEEWNEYQTWRVEEAAAAEWARVRDTRIMEIAGAYSPRFG